MAYGARAMGPIPANSPLLFSIEVVDVFPTEKPEQLQTDAIAKAKQDTPPYSVTVLQEGEGEPIRKGQKIKAHYIGTYLDGTQFDDTKNYEFTVGTGEVI